MKWNEMKWNEMNEMRVEKRWNDIRAGRKQNKSRENPTQTAIRPSRTHMERPRRELGNPAVGGERLDACAEEPPI